MASFKPREVVRILEKLGFIAKRQTGSHLIMYRSSDKKLFLFLFIKKMWDMVF